MPVAKEVKGVAQTTDSSVEELKQQNKLLHEEVEKLLALVKKQTETQSTAIVQEDSEELHKEPSSDKLIQVISLYHGILTLNAKQGGGGISLTFESYGTKKSVKYGTLVEMVNNNQRFAKEGFFYINNRDAVYHLGLSDEYQSLLPKDIIDNICSYDEATIINMAQSLPQQQREDISYHYAEKIANGDKIDLNKISALSKGLGIDIILKSKTESKE